MSEQEKGGRSYTANISGGVSGQFIQGDGNVQIQSGGADNVTEADPAEVRRMINELKARVEIEAPPEKKEEAQKYGDTMWDIFISHASEDKEAVARPLAEELSRRGYSVWYDDLTLKLGDSLRRSIDRGLRDSRFGLVILSPSFFQKEWPQRELDGFTSREANGAKVILPVWHQVSRKDVATYSPVLADRLGARTSEGIEAVCNAVEEVLRESSPTSEASPQTVPTTPSGSSRDRGRGA